MTEPSEPTLTLQYPATDTNFAIDGSLQRNTIEFRNEVIGPIAMITPDGIMHFTVDPTEENAAAFVNCIESFLSTRINGIVVKGHHGPTDAERLEAEFKTQVPKTIANAPSEFMPEARQFAAQCWCDPETEHIVMDPIIAEAIAWRIAQWMSNAAQHHRNEEFYRGLLDKVAAELGPVRPKVFVCDDGTIAIDPLRLKIPELVAELAAAATKWKLVEETANKPAPDPNFEPYRRSGEILRKLESKLGSGFLSMYLEERRIVYQWKFKAGEEYRGSMVKLHPAQLLDDTVDRLVDTFVMVMRRQAGL